MKYRKKPVEVEAVQFNGENTEEIALLTGPMNFYILEKSERLYCDDPDATAEVFDELHASWILVYDGDFIVKGIKGEVYPVRADVFAETYEEA